MIHDLSRIAVDAKACRDQLVTVAVSAGYILEPRVEFFRHWM
jgi:hypothetical protein